MVFIKTFAFIVLTGVAGVLLFMALFSKAVDQSDRQATEKE